MSDFAKAIYEHVKANPGHNSETITIACRDICGKYERKSSSTAVYLSLFKRGGLLKGERLLGGNYTYEVIAPFDPTVLRQTSRK